MSEGIAKELFFLLICYYLYLCCNRIKVAAFQNCFYCKLSNVHRIPSKTSHFTNTFHFQICCSPNYSSNFFLYIDFVNFNHHYFDFGFIFLYQASRVSAHSLMESEYSLYLGLSFKFCATNELNAFTVSNPLDTATVRLSIL